MATTSRKAAPRKSPTPSVRTNQKNAPAAKKLRPTKAAAAAAPARKKATVAAGKPRPPKKAKLVRDSFTMPKVDFDLIDGLKARAIGFGRPVKKSELLRAGLQALAKLDDPSLRDVLAALPQLKPGRPGKAA